MSRWFRIFNNDLGRQYEQMGLFLLLIWAIYCYFPNHYSIYLYTSTYIHNKWWFKRVVGLIHLLSEFRYAFTTLVIQCVKMYKHTITHTYTHIYICIFIQHTHTHTHLKDYESVIMRKKYLNWNSQQFLQCRATQSVNKNDKELGRCGYWPTVGSAHRADSLPLSYFTII